MKNIYKTLAAGTTLAAALVLGSCNNAEEIKKQTADQDAKIQSLVDAKLGDLQTQVNTECSAKVDSLAMVQFTAWQDEQAKAHKGGAKHKPAKTKKEETKTKPAPAPAVTTNTNRPGTNQNNTSTNTNRAGVNSSSKATNSNRPGASAPH